MRSRWLKAPARSHSAMRSTCRNLVLMSRTDISSPSDEQGLDYRDPDAVCRSAPDFFAGEPRTSLRCFGDGSNEKRLTVRPHELSRKLIGGDDDV